MKPPVFAALIGWLALTWSIASFLKLRTADAWMLRGGVAAVGVAGAAAWVRMRPQSKAKSGSPPIAPRGVATELDALIRETEAKLAGSSPCSTLLARAGQRRLARSCIAAWMPSCSPVRCFRAKR
jgi:hypothetical protein